ncbi:MAG TPA: NAD(P)H-binding protein [Solirubrobacteraceae bacterium]
MRILITGISGFVGGKLAGRLSGAGHDLHGASRDPDRIDPPDGVVMHRADALTGLGLSGALDGVELAYYLIHSMEASAQAGGFGERDRRAAEHFAAAAAAAGVRRIVYLGGLVPSRPRPSAHLRSRRRVERVLLDAVPGSVALRASIVVGDGSRSFRFLVRLVERMPVLALPSWRDYRTQPIDERDMLDYLAAAGVSDVGGRTLDIAGPDTLSYGEMVRRLAELMLVRRPAVRLGFTQTPWTSAVAARIAGEELALVRPLMESLDGDLLADDAAARDLLGVRLHGYDAAVEHAMRDWELREPLRAR